LVATRSRLPAIAAAAGVLMPPTDTIASLDELRIWTEREGFPVVLKTDRSWGGEGVVIAKNLKQARAAFGAMSRRPSMIRAMKRVLVNRDPNLLFRKFVDPAPTITAQKFINGKLANTAAACWKGEAIGALSVEVMVSYDAIGVATVVRPTLNEQMLETAARIVRELGVSGFCGFDFVIEQGSGRAYLIEINPRATQINHIALGAGRDLVGALRARIAGEPARPPVEVTQADAIALFPQEWERDPQSNFLTSAYHDIPLEEPALIQACKAAPSSRRRSAKLPIFAK
jgi:biotin carboxylase